MKAIPLTRVVKRAWIPLVLIVVLSISALGVTRLHKIFGITTPHWKDALAPELDGLARELSATFA